MKVIGNGKKILIGTLVVIFTVFCCLLVIFPTKAATDAILSFDQSGVSVETGDTVTLIARINPGTNEVGAVELDVTFNPSVLRLDSITPNASAFNLTLDGPTIDNAGTGNTDGNGSIDVGSLTNVYTSTTNVATFVFTALSDATDSPVAFAATSDASAHGEYVVGTRTGATITVATPDITAPSFTINDGTSASYVQTDTINVTVSDASGVASQFYGYSTDSTCNASDTITTAFTSATNFSITGNHSDYLCLKATDSSSNNNVGYQLVGQLHTDNTSPIFTVNDSTSATSVKTDTINITVTDSAAGVASRYYGYSTDNTCNASDTITTAFTSATNFSITGNHSDYLCAKSTDNASNEAYQLVGQLHTDNTLPVIAESLAISSINNSNTPNYTFTSSENGTITYSGGCTSATTSAISDSNTITFSLSYGQDYDNCTIVVEDTAGNQSTSLNISAFAVTYRGDLDNNRIVNSNDFTLLADDYGEAICGPVNKADINNDCYVNTNDFTLLADDYGKSF